jgi:cytochrome b
MSQRAITVWDPLVRVFHWCLAGSFVTAWLSSHVWQNVHEWAGYAAFALVCFRVVWGLFGPHYARFTQFLRKPATVLGFLRQMVSGTEPRYIGHNPAGGVMIVGLILVMGATAVTGWMFTLDAFWGSDTLESVHEVLANTLLVMVLAHIGGVLFASIRHRENLAKAMVTGRKGAPEPGDIA